MACISWPGTGSWVWLVSLLLPQALTEHLSAKSWERPWERPRNAKKEGWAGQPGGSVPTKSGRHRGGTSPLWSRKRAENTLSWGGDTPVCSLHARSIRRRQCLPTMTRTTHTHLKNRGWCSTLFSSKTRRLSLCSCSILCFCISASSKLPSSRNLRHRGQR